MTQGMVLTLLALLLYGAWGFSYKLLTGSQAVGTAAIVFGVGVLMFK